MRALGFFEFGGPDALQVVDLPEPHPEPGEVRIRVHAATVNPTDTGLRAGRNPDRLAGLPAPHVPGMDLAGVVSEVGDGTAWRVGDPVMAMVVPLRAAGGAYADQVVLPAGSLAAVPAGADFVAAATLPMNGLTARLTLDQLALAPGQTLAVTGAAGAYGGYVVQLAKADGLRVVADAAEADEALVRQLGADEVVRRGDDVADRIREIVPGGVDGLADGAVMNELVVPAVRDGGGLAVVRGWDGTTDRGIGDRGITVHRIWVSKMDGDGAALDRLRQQADAGIVTLRVARVFPAAQAADAHRLLEAGGTRGRIVLDFSD